MKNNNLEKDFINVNEALIHAAEEGIKDETPVDTEKRMLHRKTTRYLSTTKDWTIEYSVHKNRFSVHNSSSFMAGNKANSPDFEAANMQTTSSFNSLPILLFRFD